MAITKIGTPELFDFSATNTALQLPTGTTLERPTSPSAGQWRFNTDKKYVEYWDGGSPGAWRQIDTEAPANPDDFPSQNFNVNTYFGNGGTQTIDAKFNEAANFNGASNGSQIFISDADVFSPANNDLSFSVWINTKSTNVGYIACKQNDGAPAYEWQFYMNSNGTVAIAVFTSAGSTISIATSTATVNDGSWHNVAFVIDTNTSVTVYVDKAGVTSSSWSGTMTNTSTDVGLGYGGENMPGNRLEGALDQARFFNTALTSTQIDSLYDNETTTTAATLDFPSGAGCFAAYQLDGDASDVGGTYGGVETNIGYTGLKFEPDLVWIKAREAFASHALFDSIRGVNNILSSESTNSESNLSPYGLTSFDTNGFTVSDISSGANAVNGSAGGTYSGSGAGYVAWCFNAGGAPTATNSAGAGNVPTAGSVMIDGVASTVALAGTTAATKISANTKTGFSIVKYTGTGSAGATIGHGLTSAPTLIIVKALVSTLNSSWAVYNSGLGNTKALILNSTSGTDTNAGYWNNTSPTSTVFTVGNYSVVNENTKDYISYLFHDVAGYQKIGTYTGTGASSNYISTEITAGDGGFEPAFLLVKLTTAGTNTSWVIFDNKRSTTNPRNETLFPNLSNAEYTYPDSGVDFLTNGFSLNENVGEVNTSGNTYIYLAIAADKDTSVPTQANSFSPTLYTGTGGTNHNIYTPFAPDFTWIKSRSVASSHGLYDTIRGGKKWITSNGTNSEQDTPTALQKFNPNGFTLGNDSGLWGVNAASATYVSWNWKAGGLPTINSDGTNITSIVSANQNAGFSIVKYKGIGSTASVGHGLGVAPKLIIAKCLDITSAWVVYSETTGIDKFLELNDSAAAQTASGYWGSSAPTTSVFEVNNGNSNNNSTGNSIIAYCFANIANYQKIGSYNGDGSTSHLISTEITAGDGGFEPAFLMIKGYTDGSGWVLLDNKRNSSNPRNNVLYAEAATAEQVNDIYAKVNFLSNGFELLTNDSGINMNGRSYIYLAIG